MVVDTNALLVPGTFGVDIFDELQRMGYIEIIIPESVLRELDALRRRRGKTKRAAELGYRILSEYMSKRKVLIAQDTAGGDTDNKIISMARKKDAAVLTNDAGLRRKLQREGIPAVYLRAKNRLESDY